MFALLKFDYYATIVRQNMPEREDIRSQIEKNISLGASFYWNSDYNQIMTQEDMRNMTKNYLAYMFKLPKSMFANGKRWIGIS